MAPHAEEVRYSSNSEARATSNTKTPDGTVETIPLRALLKTAPLRDFCSSFHVNFQTAFRAVWGAVLSDFENVRHANEDKRQNQDSESAITDCSKPISMEGLICETIESSHGFVDGPFYLDDSEQRLLKPHSECEQNGQTNGLGNTNWSLQLEICPSDVSTIITLRYRPNFISKETAEEYLTSFRARLSATTDTPDGVTYITPGLTNEDNERIWEWNRTLPTPIDDLVHDLIFQNVQKQPKAPAVCSWDASLDYSELHDLSSRLAFQLIAQGVGKDILVPLCFEKSAWTVVAMLAVIKAGGAFVLLDAAQPEARLLEIIKQTEAKLMIASPQQQALALRLVSEVVIVSQDMLRELPDLDTAKSTSQNQEVDATLFVVFTSGSTGLPKGVMSSHRSFVSGVHYRRSILEVPNPRVFDFASYSFDVSTDIILSTLIIGGCVCVPSNSERQNDIAGAINRLGVNSADLTPSVARLILPESVPGLQVLKLGGELSSVADVALWGSKTKLVNIYGPSECLVVTLNILAPGVDPRTIGRGHGAVTWVVDPDDHNILVPVGTVGELLVEGPIITKGYLHDPERTAAVFIGSPDWLLFGGGGCTGRKGRLYKTGDLVHYNPDGTLNFVGRKDTQVKVRGQRVELSEVEHHVQQQLFARTGIRINPVADLVIPDSGSGRPTLVAFLGMSQILQQQGYREQPDSQKLRKGMWDVTTNLNKALLKVLPQYMVPSVYVPLWQFPLNQSGKTDRRQLRAIGAALSRQDLVALRAPATATQRDQRSVPSTAMGIRVQKLWAKVFKVDAQSIANEDHFFRIGGDSLNAIQLATLASDEQISLSVADIFANPTLANMAKVTGTLVEGFEPVTRLEHLALLSNGHEERSPLEGIVGAVQQAVL